MLLVSPVHIESLLPDLIEALDNHLVNVYGPVDYTVICKESYLAGFGVLREVIYIN